MITWTLDPRSIGRWLLEDTTGGFFAPKPVMRRETVFWNSKKKKLKIKKRWKSTRSRERILWEEERRKRGGNKVNKIIDGVSKYNIELFLTILTPSQCWLQLTIEKQLGYDGE